MVPKKTLESNCLGPILARLLIRQVTLGKSLAIPPVSAFSIK